MNEFDQFKTKPLHSKAQKLPLYTPEGQETEHFLEVFGSDSDEARNAKEESYRQAASLMRDSKYNSEQEKQIKLEWIASLVAGWSFKKDFTRENVLNFLDDSPYIADAVDVFSAKHENFVAKK